MAIGNEPPPPQHNCSDTINMEDNSDLTRINDLLDPDGHDPVCITPLIHQELNSSTDTEPLTGAEKSSQEPTLLPAQPRHFPTVKHLLYLIVKSSGLWVAGGVFIMVGGTSFTRFFLLPRIYVCPNGATCPHHLFNPDEGVLRYVQTLMLYWLQFGALVAGVGMTKVLAYYASSVFQQRGDTIQILNFSLGTLKGSVWDAIQLLWKSRNYALGSFMLIFFAISLSIPLVVNRSISTVGARDLIILTFRYPQYFLLPTLLPEEWNIQHAKVLNWVDHSLLGNGTSQQTLDRFVGTYVVRDERITFNPNVVPDGPRMIKGNVNCSSAGIRTLGVQQYPFSDPPEYEITVEASLPGNGNRSRITVSSRNGLASARLPSSVSYDSIPSQYILWASNQPGWLPNATSPAPNTTTSFSVCGHSAEILEAWPEDIYRVDAIHPSEANYLIDVHNYTIGSICHGETAYTNRPVNDCLAITMNLFLTDWWNLPTPLQEPNSGYPGRMSEIFCDKGVLAPYGERKGTLEACRIDGTSWTTTLAFMLDAYIQTSVKSGNKTQELWGYAQSISWSRWWLQALIPGAVVFLYVVSVGHLIWLLREYGVYGVDSLEELTLKEVIAAAAVHADEMLDFVRQGEEIDEVKIGGSRWDNSAKATSSCELS